MGLAETHLQLLIAQLSSGWIIVYCSAPSGGEIVFAVIGGFAMDRTTIIPYTALNSVVESYVLHNLGRWRPGST